MSDTARRCWNCLWFYLSKGWAGSDVTPGEPDIFRCGRGLWDKDDAFLSQENFRRCMRQAENCVFFNDDQEDNER